MSKFSNLTAERWQFGALDGAAEGSVQSDARRLAEDAGYTAGYDRGYADGRAQAARELKAELEQAAAEQQARLSRQAEALLGSLATGISDLRTHLNTEVLELALEWTQLLLARELQHCPDAVGDLVAHSIQNLTSYSGPSVVVLNPETLGRLSPATRDRLQAAGWQLRADAGLPQDDARLETAEQIVQLGFGHRLAALQTAILGDSEPSASASSSS